MTEKKDKLIDNIDANSEDSEFVEKVVAEAEIETKADKVDDNISEAEIQEKFENSDDDSFLIKVVVFALIVIVGLFAVYFFMGGSFDSHAMSANSINTTTISSASNSDVVLATVGDEKILQSDVDKYYAVVPDYMKSVITKDVLLNQTIEAKLLIKEGESLGLTVSDADVTSQIQKVMESTGLTEDQLQAQLTENNLTLKDLQSDYKDKLLVDKVVTQEVVSKVSISDDDVKALYDKSVADGTISDVVTVKHILVSGLNDSSKNKINMIKNKYDSGVDFCSLVTNYSEDPGSVKNCGEYTFPRGQMVAEFENLSFKLKPGETGIVKTQYGYHFILGVKAESLPTFEDSKDSLSKQLISSESQKYYVTYIESLKSKYNVKILHTPLDVKTDKSVVKTSLDSDNVVVIDFFFSESNKKSMLIKSDLEKLASEFGSSVVLNTWCVPVASGDKETCISKYGADNFDKAMNLVKEKSVKGVPYLYFNDNLFVDADRSESNLKTSICSYLGTNALC